MAAATAMTRFPAGTGRDSTTGTNEPGHPHQLESRLVAGEGPTLVGLAHVPLDQSVERGLGHRAGSTPTARATTAQNQRSG